MEVVILAYLDCIHEVISIIFSVFIETVALFFVCSYLLGTNA